MKKIVQVLLKEFKDCQKILDIGVGTGRFAKPLQRKGFDVIGIDISRGMMRNARRKGVDNLLLSDACFLPFKDSYFDASLCVHVLHLISDWQTALEEICRVTKNWLFSIAHKRGSNPISKAYEELAEKKGYDARHVGLSEQEIMKIVKPAKSMKVASWISKADERLAYLRQRASSRQWRIPENVDKQIVNELKRRFAGKRYPVEIHILSWDVEDLKSYLNDQTRQ